MRYTDPLETPKNWRELELHPLCEVFPEMAPAEFEELRESMIGMGLRLPIVLFEGMILDGRHRHRVCVEEDIDPFFEEYGGPGSPFDYVVDTNLRRRNLSPARKIDVMDDLIKSYTAWAAERRKEGNALGGHGGKSVVNLPNFEASSNVVPLPERPGKVRDQVAKAIGVSGKTVSDAMTIKRKSPELWDEVLRDEKSISGAAKEVRNHSEFITLDTWKALSEADRLAAVSKPGSKSLNRQEGKSIGWANYSWNPVSGCKHNCPYCYARDSAARFYPQGFEPSLYPDRLNTPIKAKPRESDNPAERNIFTCSMADLFGKWVPEEWIAAVMETVRQSPQWQFLMLTKFPLRMIDRDVPDNVWLGTSVDSQARVKAVEDAFERVPAHTRWLSIEPLLEPVRFTKPELFHWVVIGGASASTQTPEWRPPFQWVVDLHRQFTEAGARVYLKENVVRQDFPWGDPAPQQAPAEFRIRSI